MEGSYKIPDELAEKIRRESAEIAKKHTDRALEFDVYSEFVESQKKYFQEDVNTVLELLTKLIMEGKLYIHTKLVARIKDPESALNNDGINRMDKDELMQEILKKLDETDYSLIESNNPKSKKTGKALDDIFGIAVIADTEEELEILKEELKNIFIIHDEKTKDKAGYHATHIELFNSREDEHSPLIECQLKTRQNYIQSYDHTIYKVESNMKRKLYSENRIEDNKKVKLNQKGIDKVEGVIQEYYNSGKFSVLTNLPRMWEATFKEDLETMKIQRLTEAQTLKRVYPSLVIHPQRQSR